MTKFRYDLPAHTYVCYIMTLSTLTIMGYHYQAIRSQLQLMGHKETQYELVVPTLCLIMKTNAELTQDQLTYLTPLYEKF
jgi:hypothetical protein